MNKVTLIGNLARDPEIRYTQTQIAVCSFTLAVNRQRTKNNENPGADFIRVIAWGKLGEHCSRYLQKGRKAAVVGRIQTGSYKDREGRMVYTTDIVAEQVEFLGAPQSGQNQQRDNYPQNPQGYQQAQYQAPAPQNQQMAIGEDEIPPGFEMVNEDDIPF